MGKGYSAEETLYNVESKTWRDNKRIFDRLVEKALSAKPEKMAPTERRRMLSRLQTLSTKIEREVPADILKKFKAAKME